MSLFVELRRRNVFRVGLAYLVASWLLIEASSLILDIYQAPVWISQVIVALIAIGLPIALFFAWAFEITPEGLKRESEVDRSASVTHETAKRLDLVTIVMVVLAAGLLVADRLMFEDGSDGEVVAEVGPTTTPSDASLALGVAVLPFDNLSPDPDNAFFASGVHEDVLTFLSRVDGLRVISRTSVENYKESTLSLPAIGRELGVSHVVEGSVRRAGDRVRVTVQLIDAATDEHIWAENYDRTLTDIFAIQTEIAQAIADRLQIEMSPAEAAQLAQTGTDNIEAYDLLIRGRELLGSGRLAFDQGTMTASVDLLKRAVEIDPDYLEAALQLVEACGIIQWYMPSDVSAECRELVPMTLERMRTVASDHPATRTAIGVARYRMERDLSGAVDVLSPVVAEQPNNIAALTYLALAGRRLQLWDTAKDAMRRVVELDPASLNRWMTYIEVLQNNNEFDAAIEVAQDALERFPDDPNLAVREATLRLLRDGEIDHYREVALKIPPGSRVFNVATNRHELFDSLEEALAYLDASEVKAGSGWTSWARIWSEAQVRYYWGDDEGAQATAQHALGEFPDVLDRDRSATIATGAHMVYAQNLALAGQHEKALEIYDTAMEQIQESEDVLYRLTVRRFGLAALIYSGETERAWAEAQALSGRASDITPWALYYDGTLRRGFADLPEYQQLIAELDAERAAR